MDKVLWLWFTKALKHEGLNSPGEQMADKGSSLAD